VALCVFFCGQKIWKQRISTRKCCPYGQQVVLREVEPDFIFDLEPLNLKAMRPLEILEPPTQRSIVTSLKTKTNDYTAVNIFKVSNFLHFNTTEISAEK
jgi:hypothetical protein